MNESFRIGHRHWVPASCCTRRVGGIVSSPLAVAESVLESNCSHNPLSDDAVFLTFAYGCYQKYITKYMF